VLIAVVRFDDINSSVYDNRMKEHYVGAWNTSTYRLRTPRFEACDLGRLGGGGPGWPVPVGVGGAESESD
jgi:hypothetical protein